MTDRFYWRSALFCFAVNALFGAWLYRFLPALPLGTSWGVASDTLIGSALLAVFTYYAVTPSVTGMAQRGELPRRAATPESALARFVRLPQWLRATLFALAAVLLFAAPLCALLAWLAPDGFAYWPFVLFKGAAAGVLGGVLTPFVAAAALVGEPALVKAVPRFPVLDVKLALEFYRERLGFAVLFDWDDYAGVARGGFELHLFRMGDPNLPRWTACRVNVVGIDALHAELERAGVIHPNGALANQPWGFREFTVLDLYGNAIVFGERIG